MRSALLLSLLALAGSTLAAEDDQSSSPVPSEVNVATSPSVSPVVVKIPEPTVPSNAVFYEPPPLFDPPEPRPDPLFEDDKPVEQPQSDSIMHEPPMPADRKETLLPFDGAHVHPEHTPYTPEEGLPGSCGHSWHCSWMRSCVEIAATLVAITLMLWAVVWLAIKLVRSIVRSTGLRPRSPSGSFRPEPVVARKDEKNALLEAWRNVEKEETRDKKVSFAV